MSTILVTGASGFVGLHLTRELLRQGHQVRGTVRSDERAAQVRAVLGAQAGVEIGQLSLVVAELESDRGWGDAIAGCEYVMHVASPFPPGVPENEEAVIRPARDGTLRVLRFARDAGVRRVVMTSSFAAIGYGHPPRATPFDESDWTDVEAPGVAPYIKSKALAERAAWDFVAREGHGLELVVINPTGIFGPLLGPHLSASTRIVERMLAGTVRRCPPLHFGVVDVRDVVTLHGLAMLAPEAAGQRYLAVSGEPVSMLTVAGFLRKRLGSAAAKVPTSEAPRWLLRLIALRRPQVRAMLPDLGVIRRATNAKACSQLGWKPRSAEDAIAATGESILRRQA